MLKLAKLIRVQEDLDSNDCLMWSVLDSQSSLSPDFPPPFPEYDHEIFLDSSRGIKVNVSVPQGNLVRINQNDFFPGTFDIGDVLLFTGFSNPGPLVLEFTDSIYAIGTNIQSDPQVPSGTIGPFPFTTNVTVINRQGKNIGNFNLGGMSKIEAGSETSFVGIFQETGEIAKVILNVIENGVSIPFAINKLRLKSL